MADKDYYKKCMRGYKPQLLAIRKEEAGLMAVYKAQELQQCTLGLEQTCFQGVIEGKNVSKEMIKLAALATKTQADIFHTAFVIATGKNNDIKKANKCHLKDLLKEIKQPLGTYLCYKGVIPEDYRPPMVGVMVYHPIDLYLSDTGNVHFYTRIILSELKRSGFNFGIITENDLINPDRFNPKNYPLVIYPVVLQTFWRTYRTKNDCINAITNYIKQGGTLVCIGGKPFTRALDYVDGIWLNMEEQDNSMKSMITSFLVDYLPAPNKPEDIRLAVTPEGRAILKDIPKTINVKKDITFIWDYARFPSAFSDEAADMIGSSGKFTPLFRLSTKDNPKGTVVAAVIEYGKGCKGRILYLPLYFLVPFVFSDQVSIPRDKEVFFNPVMDETPAGILKTLTRYYLNLSIKI